MSESRQLQGNYERLKLRLKRAKETHIQLTAQVVQEQTEQDNVAACSSELQQYKDEYCRLRALLDKKEGELVASYDIKKGSAPIISCSVSNKTTSFRGQLAHSC